MHQKTCKNRYIFNVILLQEGEMRRWLATESLAKRTSCTTSTVSRTNWRRPKVVGATLTSHFQTKTGRTSRPTSTNWRTRFTLLFVLLTKAFEQPVCALSPQKKPLWTFHDRSVWFLQLTGRASALNLNETVSTLMRDCAHTCYMFLSDIMLFGRSNPAMNLLVSKFPSGPRASYLV